jgi:hypothetical protein
MGIPPHGAQHQMRRGTPANLASFTGAAGEPIVDTINWRIAMQDGVAIGGYPHELALVQDIFSTIGTINNSVAVCRVWSTAGAAAITLPPASSYTPGQTLTVCDAAGVAGANNITITADSGGADTLYSSTGGAVTSDVININGASVVLISNSSAHWMLTSTS